MNTNQLPNSDCRDKIWKKLIVVPKKHLSLIIWPDTHVSMDAVEIPEQMLERGGAGAN